MEFDMVPGDQITCIMGKDNKRHYLCEDLLDTIKNSVTTFRPSKSMACLESLVTDAPATEIDVVVSGGGTKGYFMTGCSHILLHELQKQNVRINRIAGCSAGAWVGLFMLTGFGSNNWLETYYLCKERGHMYMLEAYEDMWTWIEKILPHNAFEICTDRLFISITEVTAWGLKNKMISRYTSNRDLFEACLASSAVPYISQAGVMRKFRNMWCVDGGITNNTPVFSDNLRRQLVFNLGDVFYPVKLLVHAQDHCIEALVVRGAILMSRFLQGEEIDSFSWKYPTKGTAIVADDGSEFDDVRFSTVRNTENNSRRNSVENSLFLTESLATQGVVVGFVPVAMKAYTAVVASVKRLKFSRFAVFSVLCAGGCVMYNVNRKSVDSRSIGMWMRDMII